MNKLSWKHLQSSVERLIEIWDAALRLRLRAVFAVLKPPEFWFALVWILLASSMLLGLAWFSISHYDTFLRLKPELCAKSLSNERLLLIVMAAPLGLISTLVASSEFLSIRKQQGRIGWAGTRYFWGYSVLMLLCWAVLLWAMRC